MAFRIFFKDFLASSQCLKITEKVSFNITSQAMLTFWDILSGQKLIEHAKKWGRRHKLYIFEIINSGCHLSYNFLHFEINLHLSYIIVNSGWYMLYKIQYLAKSTFICYTIKFRILLGSRAYVVRFVVDDGDWTTIGPNHEPELY